MPKLFEGTVFFAQVFASFVSLIAFVTVAVCLLEFSFDVNSCFCTLVERFLVIVVLHTDVSQYS